MTMRRLRVLAAEQAGSFRLGGVPVQKGVVPRGVLDAANELGVTIRDVAGNIYR